MLDIKSTKLKNELDIISSWNNQKKVLVSIICTTYNHEPYIEDAIKGFLIQQTDFAFEIIIHDDASTDKTALIIRSYQNKYPNIIKPIYQSENQYSQGGFKPGIYASSFAKGEFIALCEGDDYWISPKKLQKQLAFMVQYEECSMVFHQAKIEQYYAFGNLGEYTKDFGLTGLLNTNGLFFEGGSSVATASMLFKRKLINTLPEFLLNSPVGDMPLKLIFSTKGKIGYINEVMSVRRIGVPGSWNIRTRLNKEKQNNYLNGMILMLEAFNEYSNKKWELEVETKCASYARQVNEIKLSPSIDIKHRFPIYFSSLKLKHKCIFYMHFLKSKLFS